VLYPYYQPSQRYRVADRCEAEAFLPLLAGLLREAGVGLNDAVVVVSDGASWIAGMCERLGVTAQVIDVYHACEYLETIMQALGWDETQRCCERRRWYRGEVNARVWLTEHLPTPEVWLAWPEAVQTALRYLEVRQDQMAYRHYRAREWPIGSGQIEGMNKSVIGKRMKLSGMQWSRSSAARMASLRAQHCSRRPLVDHHTLRHKAFPVPVV
jgi:hypothetical protein